MADADSSELDEVVMSENWQSSVPMTPSASNPTDVNNSSGANPGTPLPTNANSSSGGGTSATKPGPLIVDDSTNNGFTTAPATSEEDNLDYDSDDDDEDDSRSNHSNNNSSNNNSMISNGTGARHHHSKHHRVQLVKGEEKRSHHNVLERKRRDLLKDSFTKLRDSVPSIPIKERVSRAEILKQAAGFIQSKVRSNTTIRAELEELMRKNRELEEQRSGKTVDEATAACPAVSGNGLAVSPVLIGAGTAREVDVKQEH